MGNTNITVTRKNGTNITDSGGGSKQVQLQRASQERSAVTAEIFSLLVLIAIAAILNILLTILLHKKFKTLPYMMLQNIIVADLLTPLLNGPLFLFGILLDKNGIILPSFCNMQGFFHSALSAVFLNTVAMIAISRCMAVVRPDLYHKIFVNKIIMRIVCLALWSSSILLCVPPLNVQGWGAYSKLDMTCWLAWLPNSAYLAYNVILTMSTLGLAVMSCLLGIKVIYFTRMVGVAPQAAEPQAHHSASTEINANPVKPPKVSLNTEIFYIVATQLLVYFVLWMPITVMDKLFLDDWELVDYRVIIAFIFLFLGRSLLNPIIMVAFSSDIRQEFVNLFFRCKCSAKPPPQNEIEL